MLFYFFIKYIWLFILLFYSLLYIIWLPKNNMWVNASIKYLWWIESWDFKSNPDFKTLTWSSTIASFNSDMKNVSVLIDYWMFQWWRNDKEANSQIDKEALSTDMMVLTHAHLDHCWRLPYLVKNGYNKPIYMTKITALQSKEMLLDYVSIMKQKIEEIQSKNNKVLNKFKSYLYIIDSYFQLKSPRLSKEDRQKLKANLYKKYWDKHIDDLYKEAKAVTEEYWIYTLDDIQKELIDVPELLFDEHDIEATFSLVKFLEVWDEQILNDSYYIDKYDSNTLSDILEKVQNWFNEHIYIDTSLYTKVRQELDELIENTKKAIDENKNIDESNNNLENLLEEAFDFVNNVKKEKSPELYDKYKKILDDYWVEDFESISDCLTKKYQIDYSLDFLYKVKKQLKIKLKTSWDKNKKLIDSIKLRFLDAGHIEWSVQALITVVTEDIAKILSKKDASIPGFKRKTTKHTNLLFSWDLWRIKDPNLSWQPEYSDLKLDYIQMESTYAWRLHPDKQKSMNDFYQAVEQAKAKVVIPTFSMQRTQEVIVSLLERMLDNWWSKDELEELKKELNEVREEYESMENKNSYKARELKTAIDFIKKDIAEVKKSSFFQNIVLDSPLSRKITNIYLNHLWKKYNLLDPDVQIELFGREVISYINTKEEQEALYTWKRKNRKEIIVSSSGMCEWGSVLSHLEKNLENRNSTVVFVWYTPPQSRWGKIKSKEPVSIEWNVYEVKCNIVDIKWFSWHIDEEEILTYLNESSISRGAKIALTHGSEARLGLSKEIKSEVLKNRKSIKVLIPDLWDTIDIKI